MSLYESKCLDGRPIPSDQTEALELGEIFNEEIASWLESVGSFDEGAVVPVNEFRTVLSHTKLNPRSVYKFLETRGVVRTTARLGTSVYRVLKGYKFNVYTGRF